jgi:hypothetical protein
MKSANGFTTTEALGCPLLLDAATYATTGEPGDDAIVEGTTASGFTTAAAAPMPTESDEPRRA